MMRGQFPSPGVEVGANIIMLRYLFLNVGSSFRTTGLRFQIVINEYLPNVLSIIRNYNLSIVGVDKLVNPLFNSLN